MVQEHAHLGGKTIAITRASGQAKETEQLIKLMGGRPYHLPTIELRSSISLNKIKEFVNVLENGGTRYIIFTSVNSVKYFCEAIEKLGIREKVKEIMKKAIIVAIGPKTAKALEERGFSVGLVPREFSSSGLVDTLKDMGVRGETVYAFRAKGASPVLREGLKRCGVLVKEIYLYEIMKPHGDRLRERFLRDLYEGKIDAIIFGSSKSVRNFFQMFKKEFSREEFRNLIRDKLTIVAIGPFTAMTLAKVGLKVDVIPSQYTFENALTALARFWSGQLGFNTANPQRIKDDLWED
ncbi:MAG: uroporphyrinogen-III synthase [Candidatus Korarchaeum sp.]|nr:uroporphyrinogen-III synthase [Candidatus Korarchaeum sp.]